MNYTIRPIGPEDAEGAAALRRMPGVFENTLGLPSYRTADSEAFIAGLGPDDHNFVAVLDDGTVIGCAGLTVCSNPRMRHVGAVGLFVHADYQARALACGVWAQSPATGWRLCGNPTRSCGKNLQRRAWRARCGSISR